MCFRLVLGKWGRNIHLLFASNSLDLLYLPMVRLCEAVIPSQSVGHFLCLTTLSPVAGQTLAKGYTCRHRHVAVPAHMFYVPSP